VFHTKFGEGVVLTLEGAAAPTRARRSTSAATACKWLALAIAKLTPIGGVAGLLGGAVCGLLFLGAKALEYQGKAAAGYDLSTDTFFMFYYLLTGFHVLHVLAAVLMLLAIALQARDGRWSRGQAHAPETVAAFWHMVDLMWIVLFPLVYVLR
jgi:nitric oxide reductase NorE protein